MEELDDCGNLALVPSQTLKNLGAKSPSDYLLVTLNFPLSSRKASNDSFALTTCALQIEAFSSAKPTDDDESQSDVIFLHPLLFDALTQAAALVLRDCNQSENSEPEETLENNRWISCEMAPFPFAPYPSLDESSRSNKSFWKCQALYQPVLELPERALIVLKCLHPQDVSSEGNVDNVQLSLRHALAGFVIVKHSLLLVPVVFGDSSKNVMCLFIVDDIRLPDGIGRGDGDLHTVDPLEWNAITGYRVGSSLNSFHVSLFEVEPFRQRQLEEGIIDDSTWLSRHWDEDCPGYEKNLDYLLSILSRSESPVIPTGILITGCSGVGKTRLVSCAASQLKERGWYVHWVNIQDLLLKASWADEDELIRAVMPPQTRRKVIVVMDDLHAIDLSDGESSHMDMERRLVQNTVTQVIDSTTSTGTGTAVGIAKDALSLPPEIVKIGRLEKELAIPPPSQQQREVILHSLLEHACVDSNKVSDWADLLASVTPGCVAADLRRLCVDALTRSNARSNTDPADLSITCTVKPPSWENFRDAAQNCIPSQLAALDVIKPMTVFEDEMNTQENWLEIHSRSWDDFIGYEDIKRRVFRTVVVPWKRSLLKDDNMARQSSAISPPSGVIFHGPSGCGKSMASRCLGSSLGLPMVNIRATDVLNKWLGGSEAAVRALFARARSASPCILFFDEIDAIASNRSNIGESTDVMSRLLSTLLNEMDGISSGHQPKFLVVACTNRLSSLDAALLRPGRLEEHIELSRPSVDDAKRILLHSFGRVELDNNLDIDSIIIQLFELRVSGAQLEGLGREAVLRWIRETNTVSPLSLDYIEQAISALHLKR